jgi:hypothetical protein
MSFTKGHSFLANIVQISYNNVPQNRPQSVPFLDIVLEYNLSESNDLYCQYENKEHNIIVIGFHGAKTLEESILAVSKLISPSFEDRVINSFCDKYKQLVQKKQEGVNVILAAHSLGCFAIAECSIRFGEIPAVLFAPYNPLSTGRNADRQRSGLLVKILYASDWLANNLLVKEPSKAKNVILLQTGTDFKSVLQTINERVGNLFRFNVARVANQKHGIENFTKGAEAMNKNIVEFR